MSKYHYGPYSSLTPRLQSSNPTSDLYSAHGLLNQLKSQQRSETLSPDAPKKSPTKSSKPSKSQLENQLRSSKGLKKSSKTTKGKTKKSNSPPNRDPLAPNNGEIKKKLSKPQLAGNTYEIDNVGKHKSSSVKSLSIPQGMFNQPGYEANFANWLSEKVKSPKNPNVNSLTGPIGHSAELIIPNHPEDRFQGRDPHNVWPETKKTYKIESQSHRQSLESPTGTTPSTTTSNAKKSLQNQLSAFAGHIEGQKSGSVSLAEGDKLGKGISKQKIGSQKLSLGSKDPIETAKKLTLKVSPRTLDPYIGLPHPLSTQSQTNTQPKMNSLDAQSLGSSYNFEFQKDAKRVSLDPSQSSYSNDQQLLDFPKSAKNQNRPKGNFFKDSPPSKKDDSSARVKEMSPGPRLSHEEAKMPARLKSAKHSDPNIYNDLNAYMSLMLNGKAKRASDSQLQVQALAQAQAEGEGHVLSTRSALDKYENRLGLKSATVRLGETLEDSSKTNKKGDVNNGKPLGPKSQMQEKRSKANFKSADWSIPSQNNPVRQMSGFEKSSRNEEPSPEQVGRYRKSQEYSEDKEGEPTKGQLYQILHRTGQVLSAYKHKENTWGREKKELLAEVKYLRSVIEKMK